MRFRSFSLSGMLFLFMLLAACFGLAPAAIAAAAPPASVPSSASARGSVAPAAKALSDAQIEQDLRARLSRSKLAAKKFQFKVQGGVATIDGRTDVIQHKGIMTRMAKAAGARAVVNRIEISEAARAKAAQRLEEGRTRKAVVVRR